LAVACGQAALALEMVQLQGKRAVSGEELLRGYPALASATLGT
jgi:methionyl-tRNA formyltransferase